MNDIAGTWRLVRTRAFTDDGGERPAPYGGDTGMGVVVLGTDGRMIAVLCDGRSSLPDGAPREYNSYCGNYSFDGQQLVTRVDAASDPARMGTDQIRDVRFEGEFMVLRPPSREMDGGLEHRELYWKRVADA